MKYIDAELLRKEVKRLEKTAHKSALGCADSETRKFHEGKDFAYQHISILIESLQQEQPDFPTTDEEVEKALASIQKVELPDKYKTPDWLFKQPEQLASEELEKEMDEMWLEYCEDIDYLVYASIARHFAEWGMNQCPLPEDATIFQKGVAEGRRLEHEEQRPELVQHPAISYMYNADAGRGEQLKQAILALLKSDLIQVAGRRFTKTELIKWVDTRPTEMEEGEK